jgi:hypothetical protein
MSLQSTLRDGRKHRKSLMTERCQIKRPSEERTFDPETGEYTNSEVLIYEGICQFKSWSSLGYRLGNVADREMTVMNYEVLIPYEEQTNEVGESDIVYITESQDSWAVGKPLPIYSVELGHDRTCRHLTIGEQGKGDVDYG